MLGTEPIARCKSTSDVERVLFVASDASRSDYAGRQQPQLGFASQRDPGPMRSCGPTWRSERLHGDDTRRDVATTAELRLLPLLFTSLKKIGEQL